MLCMCGCGGLTTIEKKTRRGYVAGDYHQFIHGHATRVLTGPLSGRWKGEAASYRALHAWLIKNFPKTGICDECGAEARTDYSLIHDRDYSRNRDDYRELCRPCHNAYDYHWRLNAEQEAQSCA